MPAALAGGAQQPRRTPSAIYTQIAIEQIDGNISFFKNDVPAAFKEVTDKALLAEFKQTNDSVIARCGAYKTFLQKELLPKVERRFAYGAETYAKALAAQEMVDTAARPAAADCRGRSPEERRRHSKRRRSRSIRPSRPTRVLATLQLDHPPAGQAAAGRRRTRSIRFASSSSITTSSRFPPSDPAHVKETPPFMRSTTISVDGHAGTVRDREAAGVLQHDPA